MQWQSNHRDAQRGKLERRLETDEGGRIEAVKIDNALTMAKLQHQFAMLIDNTKLRQHIEDLQTKNDFTTIMRLKELRDPKANHDWVVRIDRAAGPTMLEHDYVWAVQLRLGSRIVHGAVCVWSVWAAFFMHEVCACRMLR